MKANSGAEWKRHAFTREFNQSRKESAHCRHR